MKEEIICKLRSKYRLVSITEYLQKIGVAIVSNGVTSFSVPLQLLGTEPIIMGDEPENEREKEFHKQITNSISYQTAYGIDHTFTVVSITVKGKELSYMSQEFIFALANNEAVHVQLYEQSTDSLFYLPIHMVEFV